LVTEVIDERERLRGEVDQWRGHEDHPDDPRPTRCLEQVPDGRDEAESADAKRDHQGPDQQVDSKCRESWGERQTGHGGDCGETQRQNTWSGPAEGRLARAQQPDPDGE
jgi:hypothetical protein